MSRRCRNPEFRDAERSVMAEGIAEIKVGYFGRDRQGRRRRRADVARSLGRPAAIAAPAHPASLSRVAARPMLVVEPRRSPEAGCAFWDTGQGRCARGGRCSPQRDIALIVVLWLTMLITVIGSSFAYSMRSEALAARNTMSLAGARGRRRGRRAHGVRAVTAAHFGGGYGTRTASRTRGATATSP